MNDSIIVLGGSGFLGKNIVQSLLKQNLSAIASTGMHRASKRSAVVKYHCVDILNKTQLEKTIAPYSTVINCTGQITAPITSCLNINTQGISNLVAAVKNKHKKVVHLSTVGVYGTCNKADESSPLNPETPYSTCKGFAEYVLQHELPPAQLTIIRLSNVYGMGTKGILGTLLHSYHSDRRLSISNNGEVLRYYLNVEDAAENIVKLIMNRTHSGIYNLVGNEKYTIKQLIQKVERLSKKAFKTHYYPMVLPLENIISLSDSKIQRVFKLNYSHSVKEFINKHFVSNKSTQYSKIAY